MSPFEIDPIRDPRWRRLIETHPLASVFHTVEWLEALHRTYGYRAVAFTTSRPSEELKNGMVFCRIHSWLTGLRMVSLPFSEHCEPLVESPEDLCSLVDWLQAEMHHRDWKYLELRPMNGSFNPSARNGDFHAAALYCHHRLGLRPPLEDIFQRLHKDSVQRRVRHAERIGLVCECGRSGKLLKDFYTVFLMTRRRHRVPPQPYAWFRNLIDAMGSALEIRVAYQGNVPVAAILTLHFRKIVYYKYGGSNAEFKGTGAMALLLWNAIRDSKDGGAEEIDLGRSDVENKGLIAFKDRWTERRTEMVYWRYPAFDHLAEGWRLRAARRIFAFMPQGLLAIAGRVLYRHIG